MTQLLDEQRPPSDADGFLSRVVAAVDDPAAVTGVILHGSWAKETNDASSDVDLLLIQRSGPAAEETRSVLGVEVEINRATAQEFRQRMLKDHPLNNNFILNALHDGVVFLDRKGDAARLSAEAEAVWKAGPRAASAEEVAATRKALNKMLAAARRLSGRASGSRQAELVAEMRSHQVVVQAVYLYHRSRRLWAAGFPEMMGRLAAENPPRLYGLWRQYVEAGSQEERVRVAAAFVESVYE
jgi:predicted nucleotidyltransferase